MSKLDKRIDFEALVLVENANPNGDPLEENRCRTRTDGRGETSDVCIKRKIRNRFQDLGYPIFVQADGRSDDGFRSLKERADNCEELKVLMKGKGTDVEAYTKVVCEKWLDVRAFGQVFAFKGSSVSVGVRGPVTVQTATSVSTVEVESKQITRCVNAEAVEGIASDRMGMKHSIPFGLYVIRGSISAYLAERTGFSEEDAEVLKEALKTLFVGDESAARPAGSMEVERLYWWKHNTKLPEVSPKAVFDSVKIQPKVDIPSKFEDYEITLETPEGCVEPEIF